jgi:hypothetical protein
VKGVEWESREDAKVIRKEPMGKDGSCGDGEMR